MEYGGEIQNVGLKNSYFRGRNYIGGICGSNYKTGTIRNCYSEANVTGVVVGADIGGVVGENNGTVENCYNTGNVVGNKWVGGVCGYNDGTNNNCYNTGKVTGTSYVGDVCGQNDKGTLTNCYYLADSETNNNDGTFGKTAEQFASGEVAYLLNGSESTDVAFCQNLDNGEPTDATPVLDSTHGTVYQFTNCNHADTYTNNKDAKSGDHSWDDNGFCRYNDSHYAEPEQVNGVYQIENAGQLYWFAAQVNDGKINDADAVLTADITVNEGDVAGCDGTKTEGWRDWTPINGTYYISTFDGQGHVIRGLYFNDTSVGNIGLFSHLYKDGKIQNVGLENSYFRGATDIVGICADNAGTIENCYSAGTISAMYGHVGGLVSNNFGSVINCYNTGNITADDRTGGGVVAWNRSGGTIKNCYSTGTLTGGDMNGVVQDNDGTIKNCYYLSDSETDSFDETTAKTAEQFASGEVCYLLNKNSGSETPIYYQLLGTDKSPVLDSTHKQVY